MADKHPKRPRDFSQAAKLVVDIASGQVEDQKIAGKTPKRAKGGSIGGTARAANMTPDERAEAARLAVQARWRRKP